MVNMHQRSLNTTVKANAERAWREATRIRETKAQAAAFEPTGLGFYHGHSGVAHKPVKMLPSTGSNSDDDLKA